MSRFYQSLNALMILALAACTKPQTEIKTQMHHDLSGEYVVSSIAGNHTAPQPSAVIQKTQAGYVISGHSGCNRYHASLQLIGKQLKISNAATTRMLCEPASMQVEQQFLDYLNQATSWQQTATGIRLGELELSRKSSAE